MSLCRKMVPNRHLQKGPKFNKKAETKIGSSEVSVYIFRRPCARKWHLTDTLQWGQSQNMRGIIAVGLQRIWQRPFSCIGSAKNQTDTNVLKFCKEHTLSEVSVSLSMSWCGKMDLNRHLWVSKKTISTKVGAGFGSQFPRACAWKYTLTDTSNKASNHIGMKCRLVYVRSHFCWACAGKRYLTDTLKRFK